MPGERKPSSKSKKEKPAGGGARARPATGDSLNA